MNASAQIERSDVISTDDVILAIEGLNVSLPAGMDRDHAVRDISVELRRGEILCVIGESGSGKSVMSNAVMGLLPPQLKPVAGRIVFDGRDLLTEPPEALRDLRGRAISMIFQDPLSALNPLMTVGDQIAGVMRAHGVGTAQTRRARALELVREVGLPDPELMLLQYPFRLSGGQRQRVMIAMALALEPQILIADEPTTALDVTTQAQILELIRDIQRRKGMSVMFVTHDFGVVSEIADRVLVMEKGHLVEAGTVQKVLTRPEHPYTQRLVAAVPRMRGDTREGMQGTPVVLKVENLRKVYRSGGGFLSKERRVVAVDDVSFELRKGRTLGVVGESGSGKSSLGKLLMKLIDCDGGRIILNGEDVAAMPEAAFRPYRKTIQMVFQDPFASLNPRHTIGRILTAGPVTYGETPGVARAAARRYLDMVGLSTSAFDRYPHEFSGGQRQRIGIARALMFDPQVIVADEAISALDVSIQAQILKLFADVQAETKVGLVFITHDLRVASQICDEVLVMHKGRVVESGPPAQIFLSPGDDYTRRLVAAIPGAEITLSHDGSPQP
ncbi:ABC transporter ATP-binding protein [Paenirhodobacter populi]|uniref:ABC transporter ATP-binding protein n=1 Tax=Paenirhodobacter populi TaxID=2306993 RepID=A0A443J1G3_9RHOB|nr:ABC transporter ATP-binding protein [Sinirhodobacter populi]